MIHGIGSIVTVRFDSDEAAQLRAIAKRRGLSYTEAVKEAVRNAAHNDQMNLSNSLTRTSAGS